MRSSSVKPVVPTTACMPCMASHGSVRRAASATVKSTTTSHAASANVRRSPPITSPLRCCSPAANGSTPATKSRSSAASIAAQTAAPIRPPAPLTPTLMRSLTVTDGSQAGATSETGEGLIGTITKLRRVGSYSVQAVGSRPWGRRRNELATRDRNVLTADELDELADAWFWLDDPDMSMAVRREAYRRHVDAADLRGAAGAAWRLFTDHHLVGEIAPAAGWLERCRRHVDEGAGPASAGWLSIADADCAASTGDHVGALRHANAAKEAGRRSRDPDLTAMALQAEGRARISLGERTEGLRDLDEAMIAVTNGELQPLFTGWVYCNVVSTCYAVADLRRATEWSDEAMRWCATLARGPHVSRVVPGVRRRARLSARRLGHGVRSRPPGLPGADRVRSSVRRRCVLPGRRPSASARVTRRGRGGLSPRPRTRSPAPTRPGAHASSPEGIPPMRWVRCGRRGRRRPALLSPEHGSSPRSSKWRAYSVTSTRSVAAVAELGTIAGGSGQPIPSTVTDEAARGDLSLLAGEPHGAVIRLRAAAADIGPTGLPLRGGSPTGSTGPCARPQRAIRRCRTRSCTRRSLSSTVSAP